MSESTYDALVIGGGPGGSTAATFLAQAGRRVLVLEKEIFPRFHIGESLLPYHHGLFAEMGVLPKLEALGLIRKTGAQFHLGNGSKSLFLVFRNGRFTREATAFQVERATFDHVLLQHARDCGAEVREGVTVTKFSSNDKGVTLYVRNSDGKVEMLHGRFLIDASGRGNLTGNQEGLREIHPRLKKLAVFGHFANVARDAGEKGGDTVIVRLENKWFWLIPLSAGKTSVGVVLDQEEFARAKESPETLFQRLWQGSSALASRMREAELLGPMHTTGDFSYHNRRLVGERLLRVGDAAGFMDPIFSAGVYLAGYSARLAAQAVIESLAADDDGAGRFARYERRIDRAMRSYWELVEGFYTTPFMELFLEPRHRYSVPAAVVALLAGELEGGWKIRWRMRVFFWLIKLQARRPLVPHISFASIPARAAESKPDPALIGDESTQ